MTFGSLFAGIGGLDLGLERAGLVCRWQVEINPFSRAVLAKHWPDVERFEDVRTVGAHNLAPVDLVCGGFPCQDISSAGKRVGITGERSGLWTEYARVVRELRPRYVLVENVAALLVRGIDVVLGDLAAIGFDAEWTVLRASDVGLPHRRERVFLVAYAECDARGDLEQRIERGSARDGQEPGEAGERRMADAAGEGWGPGMRPHIAVAGDGAEAVRTGPPEPRRRDRAVADTGHGQPEERANDDCLDGERPPIGGRAEQPAGPRAGGRAISGHRPARAGVDRPPTAGNQGDVADAYLGRLEGSRLAEPRRLEGARGDLPNGSRADGRQLDAENTGSGRVADAEGLRHDVRPHARRAGASDESGRDQGLRREPVGSGRARLFADARPDLLALAPAGPGRPQHAWEPPRTLTAESRVGGGPDGVPVGLVPHRRQQLEAYGNAVVPQIAEWIGRRLMEVCAS